MNLLVAPLSAVLIGLFVRSRLIGAALFISIEALVFTFQTLVVLLAWMSGQGGFGGAVDQGAFGPFPTQFPIAFSESEVWAYGLLNVAIVAVGLLLTTGIATWRRRRRDGPSNNVKTPPGWKPRGVS